MGIGKGIRDVVQSWSVFAAVFVFFLGLAFLAAYKSGNGQHWLFAAFGCLLVLCVIGGVFLGTVIGSGGSDLDRTLLPRKRPGSLPRSDLDIPMPSVKPPKPSEVWMYGFEGESGMELVGYTDIRRFALIWEDEVPNGITKKVDVNAPFSDAEFREFDGKKRICRVLNEVLAENDLGE